MVFSKESCRANVEMCYVELIELKKSSIQCPSCFHYVFEGTCLCNCGKLVKLDPDAINRIKEAFEIHHKDRDALRSATKGDRGFTTIWDRWQNDDIYRQSQLAHNWSNALVRYLDHIVHFSIYHNVTQQQRERRVHILYLRSVDENRQASLSQRPRYWEAKPN